MCLGNHGNGRKKTRGERFLDFCIEHHLVIASTCCEKKYYYNTWTSTLGNGRGCQLAHVCVQRCAMQRVVDCGHMRTLICNSDHTGIKLTFLTGKLKQHTRPQRSQRQELVQHDHTELETEEGRKLYNDKCSASIAETIANGGTCIEAIHTACAKAAATLPRKTNDPTANWFSMHNDNMTAAIRKRNAAKKKHEQAPTKANRAELRRQRQSVKDLTARCKGPLSFKGAWV
jgi:hypothetical protein